MITISQLRDHHDWCENNNLPILCCCHLLQSKEKQSSEQMHCLQQDKSTICVLRIQSTVRPNGVLANGMVQVSDL